METQTKYEIIQIVSQIMKSNCYLINYENKTIIIDPCVDVKTLKKYNVQEVEAVLLTHSHVDHIYYLEEITKEFNPVVYLFSEGLDMIYDDDLNLSIYFGGGLNIKEDSFKYKLLNDDEVIIDKINVKCIHTPGHTKDSMCYLINNDLFTGDTLFDRSIGRTDFPTGNTDEMRKSLKRILDFNKNYTIYPGHNNSSTIDEQKEKNNYLTF